MWESRPSWQRGGGGLHGRQWTTYLEPGLQSSSQPGKQKASEDEGCGADCGSDDAIRNQESPGRWGRASLGKLLGDVAGQQGENGVLNQDDRNRAQEVDNQAPEPPQLSCRKC